MAYDIPQTEPLSFVAGDSWKWDKSFGDFPAGDGWQLSYYFRGPNDLDAEWGTEVTASGDSFEVRIDATSTSLTPGPYELYGRVTDGTDTHTVVRRNVVIQANPATAVASESLAKTMLDLYDTAIQNQATNNPGKRVIEINGRRIEYASEEALIRDRDMWAVRYEIERNPDRRLAHAARFTG